MFVAGIPRPRVSRMRRFRHWRMMERSTLREKLHGVGSAG